MKVQTEDGKEIDVLTQEEAATQLKEKEDAIKSEYDAKIKELEQDLNPNWRDARAKLKEQETKLKEYEEKYGEQKPSQVTLEEVESRAKASARQEMIEIEKERLFSNYKDEQREVVKKYFDKLTTGEELSLNNIHSFVKQAEQLVIPQIDSKVNTFSVSGRPPLMDNEKDDFSNTDNGKSLGERMGMRFPNANKDNK